MNLTDLPELPHCRVVRDGYFESVGIVIHHKPRMLTFLDSESFLDPVLQNPFVSCVVTRQEFVELLPDHIGLIISDCPRTLFYEIHNYLGEKTDFYQWKSFPSEISPQADVHFSAYIAPTDVRIGSSSIIEPRAVILERTIIEDNVIVGSGSVIGSRGYEFKWLDNRILKVVHTGGVWIHSRVEIRDNVVINRAVMGGFTEIDEDTKIDSLAYVAHNVHIGKRNLIIGQAMLCGSVTVGDDVWIGPCALVSHGLEIGDRAYISLGSVVTQDVPPDQHVSGNWAIDHEKFITFMRSIR